MEHYNSLFTLLMQTRQNCLDLSALAVQTRQDSFVLSQPSFDAVCLVSTQFSISKFSVMLNIFETEQLQIGNFQFATVRQDKTVLSCRQLCSHRRHRRDKTRQFCLVRVGSMNKPKVTYRFIDRTP